MASFDLERFRELAFGGRAVLPDHPLATVADADRLLAELEGQPADTALADLTSLVKTMNETDSFTAGRRARILLRLDDAARPLWRVLGGRYLAPGGVPLDADGDASILRAFFDSASEFTNGFAIALDTASAQPSDWLQRNVGRLYLRNMRWLGRRLALAHMLRMPVTSALWERIHRLHGLAEEAKVARLQQPVFEGNRFTSSVRQEYVRALLLELAAPASMTGRQIELVYRVTGRVAPSVRLEAAASGGTAFAVVPAGDSRPGPVSQLGANVAPAPVYIDTSLALPKLRTGLERDMGRDPKEPDTLYGGEFRLRERFAVMNRLLEHWGMDPPRRRMKRVSMASPARIIHGFSSVAEVLPARNVAAAPSRVDLQIKIDETTRSLSRAKLRAAQRVGPGRVIDASNGGLGVALKPADARWAALGVLVGVLIEPGKEWVVGVVRRLFAMDDELRLGIQVISTRATLLSFSTETTKRDQVWEEAMKYEATFKDRFKKGIFLGDGDMLVEPALASKGDQYDVFTGRSMERIRITRVLAASEHYQRVMFEALKTA
jgi:hypothetical protein